MNLVWFFLSIELVESFNFRKSTSRFRAEILD